MPFKLLPIALLMIVAGLGFAQPCYCAAGETAIKPPGNVPHDMTDGSTIVISGALPNDWKENQNYITPDGSYSNTLFYDSQTASMGSNKFKVKIWLDGTLSNGTSTIPIDNLKYLCTYVYMYYGNLDPRNGSGLGSKQDKYRSFSPSETEVYYSTAQEYPVFPTPVVQAQIQFKYAVQVPDDQAPGTYTGATIKYKIVGDDGFISATRSTPLSITVGTVFKLSIDRGMIDFEKMSPGETKDNIPVEGVIATSKTNAGNPWYLKISNDSPLSSGPYIISNSNFIWYGWSDGKGRWYGNGTDQLSLTPMLVYSGGASEGNNLPNGTLNHLKFKLTVPRGQAGGRYMSTVRLTMTE